MVANYIHACGMEVITSHGFDPRGALFIACMKILKFELFHIMYTYAKQLLTRTYIHV